MLLLQLVEGASGAKPDASCRQAKEHRVLDILMVFSTIAFFLLAVAYTRGCDRLDRKPAGNNFRKEAGNA